MNGRGPFRSALKMPSVAKEWVRPYYLKWGYARMFADRYPPEFAQCWEYPAHPLDPRLGAWVEKAGERTDILFLPAADWHTRMQRSQHLAVELARMGHRCFYLNPHLGREFPHPYPLSRRAMISRLLPRVYELHVHLPREPVYHHRPLTLRESATIASTIGTCFQSVDRIKPVIVAGLPLWVPVAQSLKRRYGCRVVYDCHDLWSGFGRMHEGIVAAEPAMFASSDAVVFSAHWLREEKCALHQGLQFKSATIRNAVQPGDFDFLNQRPRAGRKTVAYSGSLDFWFDVESVRFAATRHPEWDFLLLGRIENERVRRLQSLPNVRMTGEVPYSSLREHFAAADVCMIPFRLCPLTMATNPLKLYEYFACGHPVVSSPLPEVLEFGNLVYVARGPREFTAQLEAAMAENDLSARRERRRIAEQETWTARCHLLIDHLEPERTAIHGYPVAAAG